MTRGGMVVWVFTLAILTALFCFLGIELMENLGLLPEEGMF